MKLPDHWTEPFSSTVSADVLLDSDGNCTVLTAGPLPPNGPPQ